MELAYSPLVEAPNDVGWDKQTVTYVTEHRSKVCKIIRGMIKNNTMVSSADVDDIYMELLLYLYKCADYDIDIACERSGSSDSIISLEGYVHSCIKYCTIRYTTKVYKESSHIVRDTIKSDDDGERSIFDIIPDTRSEIQIENTMYNLYSTCKAYEYQRYKLGVDVYMIWFIRLKTTLCNKDYEQIIRALGITKRDLSSIEKDASTDGIMLNIAKAITVTESTEKAIEIIREFVYAADKIEQAINSF